MHEVDKLPQSRRYLRAAEWSFENLKSQMLIGRGAVFHMIGVLACLRAVQHALLKHDCSLSPQHKEVISDWKKATEHWNEIPDLEFIVTSRNLLLKEADFPGYAIHSESGVGEGANRVVTDEHYELIYYVGDERRDLDAAIRSAIEWCEGELRKIEAQLPARYADDPIDDGWSFTDGELYEG